MDAVSFPAWPDGPVVIAKIDPMTLMLFWFKGDVYAVTGTVLAKDSPIDPVAAGLGLTVRPATKSKELHWLRTQVDIPGIRQLFPEPPREPEPEPESEPPRLSAEDQALLEAREQAEAFARDEEYRLLAFLKDYKSVSVRDRDPRVPREVSKVGPFKGLVIIEIEDRRGKTAFVVGSSAGQFWPAIPGRDDGMGAAARNRWAAQEITNRYAAFKVS